MDQNERQPENKVTIDKDAQINLTVNAPNAEEDSINLGRVFHNMKVKRRVFAWVLVLCLVVGVCAPLLLYQFSKPMLTVSSAVTLKYEVAMVRTASGSLIPLADSTEEDPEIVWFPVSDLTAPDGSALDLSLITSSYVLQKALSGMELSQPVSLSALRNNISIEKVLTDESRQAQELASKMTDDKDKSAYEQIQAIEMKYDTRFVVRLKNGFGDEESRVKLELTDDELHTLLDRILTAYNDYLVETYANRKRPDNEAAEIKTDELDLLESLERLQAASDGLYDYCDNQRDSVKAYRSSRDGRNLEDWMEALLTEREVSIDYLYSYVYTNSIVRNPQKMLTTYENKKRDNERNLEEVKDKITLDVNTKTNDYQKPTIIVSMQESGTVMTTQKTPDSFNELVLRLAKNYEKRATLEIAGNDLDSKIAALKKLSGSAAQDEVEKAAAELEKTKATFERIYDSVYAHMEEVMDSAFYNSYAEHTVPQGKLDNFLVANLKKIIIGAVAGAAIACGLWFLAALAPEFRRNKEEDPDEPDALNGKEAAKA